LQPRELGLFTLSKMLCQREGTFHDPAESDEASYSPHPIDEIEPQAHCHGDMSHQNRAIYREASIHCAFIMNRAYDFVMHADNKIVALWQSAFGLGLSCCEGTSMTRAGEICGVSKANISKGARRFCEINDLPPSFYMKSEESVKKSRKARKAQL
jgi:hypothetical protein